MHISEEIKLLLVMFVHVAVLVAADTIKLLLEMKKGNQISEETLKAKIIDDFVGHLEITPTVEFVQEGVLPRVEGKSQKVLRTL